MADRGIIVQDLFANQNVSVNIPTLLIGKSQLEPEELFKTEVASKQIQVEMVIGLAKRFKILIQELLSLKVPIAFSIVYLCFCCPIFEKLWLIKVHTCMPVVHSYANIINLMNVCFCHVHTVKIFRNCLRTYFLKSTYF